MDHNLFDQMVFTMGRMETAGRIQVQIAPFCGSARGDAATSYAIGAFYATVEILWSLRDPDLSALQFLAILQRHAADAIQQPEAA